MHRLAVALAGLPCAASAAAAAAARELAEEEGRTAAYFGKATPPGLPQAAPRYSKLSRERFEALATSGRPFVVEDAGEGQPFVGWTCERFKEVYPDGVVKIEYAKGTGQNTWPMASDWEKKLHKIPNADPLGPQYAPWYWGVKGADEPEEAATIFTGGRNPLPSVRSGMRLPPWMRPSKENSQEVLGSPEFWLSAPGAGAAMHMDAHCESTFALQLSGSRRWRVGWAPPVPNGTLYADGTFEDGEVYGKDYSPPLEAVVSEGQGFFMSSAFLHETSNVGDSCAVSLTFQFRDPVPAGYFRQHLRHLRRVEDFAECWPLMAKVAGLGRKRRRDAAAPVFGRQDADGDGVLTTAEAEATGERLARASHAFYDADGDGSVTAGELESGWAAWQEAEAEARSKAIRKRRPKTFSHLAERREL